MGFAVYMEVDVSFKQIAVYSVHYLEFIKS